MSASSMALVELLLAAGGVFAFGIWQLRSLARDRTITNERERAASAARDAAGHSEG